MDFPWNDQSINVMRAMIKNGHSRSEIAARLSSIFGVKLSRNAVIGKARRLGIGTPRHSAPAAKKAEPKKRRAPRSEKPAVIATPARDTGSKPEPKKLIPTELHPETMAKVSVIDVAKGQCRFPIDEERDGFALFCGNAALHGKPYCSHHDARSNLSRGARKAALTTPPPPGIPEKVWLTAMKAYARGVMASDCAEIIKSAGYEITCQSIGQKVFHNFLRVQGDT